MGGFRLITMQNFELGTGCIEMNGYKMTIKGHWYSIFHRCNMERV